MIAVTNAASNAPICDAQVTASGSAEFTLAASSTGGGPCVYTGPGIIGPFTITVSKVGFQTATLNDVNATIQTCDGPKMSIQVISVKLSQN